MILATFASAMAEQGRANTFVPSSDLWGGAPVTTRSLKFSSCAMRESGRGSICAQKTQIALGEGRMASNKYPRRIPVCCVCQVTEDDLMTFSVCCGL